MTFDEVLQQVKDLLQHEGRISYRILKRRFNLNDEDIEDLKADLIDAKRIAVDEDGKVLVWVAAPDTLAQLAVDSAPARSPQTVADHSTREAERRQLTVMFCDVVGSTALSQRHDPEELRTAMQAYQKACVAVISRFDGYVAKYLGDGVLVYFGYPTAHEDGAARAVRAGLGIVEAIQHLPLCFPLPTPLQVRVSIHTGLVVAGEMGSGEYREERAIVGEAPNIAARLQEKALPNRVVISPTTYRLVTGLFECEELGPQILKGLSSPLEVYAVVRESEAQSRFEVAIRTGLTPLIGREHEMGLLRERWERARQGSGQVVLLSGEPGIGKSRLVEELKDQLTREEATRIEFRCSAYHQNSAFYPIIEQLQRVLQFAPHDTPPDRTARLGQMLASYRFSQPDTLPLLASLLSLPAPADAPPLTFSPQKQKQKTQEVLVSWIVEEAQRRIVYCAWEDLHWADPSTLETLTLVLDQVPTMRLLALLTFRPEFTPPWRPRSHMAQLTLNRLGRPQVEAMVEQVTGNRAFPPEVLQQIVSKTDGVPLFVEELTKMVLESGLVRPVNGRYELTGPLPALAIPSTLHDSLMARLDRLSTVREIVQLGATLGREFSYELLHAVSSLNEQILQQGLWQLVEAEVVYQRGLPPNATYVFKHALIQDAAYQSLLKSKRQHYHEQIAQILEARFPEIGETQPELVARHYSEAGLIAHSIPYWRRAGQRAIARSAHVEAIRHLTAGLELLKSLPDTPERSQQELMLQTVLGPALMAMKGYGAPEVEKSYARALELCRQIGETPRLLQVLMGLGTFYFTRGQLKIAYELRERCLQFAQQTPSRTRQQQAHLVFANSLFYMGELASAREHMQQAIALYDFDHRQSQRAFQDPGIDCLSYMALILWSLGYPEQAMERSRQALTLAQALSHPLSSVVALVIAAWLHNVRREESIVQERAETAMTLSNEQGFSLWAAFAAIFLGWALTQQGQDAEGIVQLRRGLAESRAKGAEGTHSFFFSMLADAYAKAGQSDEGLQAVADAFVIVENTSERFWEAELYRLKAELILHSRLAGLQSKVDEAEGLFLKAIEVARRQQAKSWELRAAISLSRLWQQQGRKTEARQMVAEIYGWFTEGFDTADLKDAKALLEELSNSPR